MKKVIPIAVVLVVLSLAASCVAGADLARVTETAKEFTQCMVPLEHQVSLFGWQLGKTFEGTAILLARVKLGGKTYDLWTVPTDVFRHPIELMAENVGKPVLAVLESTSPTSFEEYSVYPSLVITPASELTPLATLCSIRAPEDLKNRQGVIVGFDKREGKIVHFISFAKAKYFLDSGTLDWEHKRTNVAGALVLIWNGTGETPQDFLAIGTYGPWRYTEYRVSGDTREAVGMYKRDFVPLLPIAMKPTLLKLSKWRALNIVRAAFGLELEPEPEETPEAEW